ncbi:MAG: 1-deoxy-D-xylulose-5-phosphate reductoisomerase [bacterium]
MNIVVLGGTGSIGRCSLRVIQALGFKLLGISGGKNISLLEEEARKYLPPVVAIADEKKFDELKDRLRDLPCKVLGGQEGILELASLKGADRVIIAISGAASLLPTLYAIRAGKNVCLASKEAFVLAGEILKNEAKERNVSIIPIDSEHSAIFQCISGKEKPERIILTASGGPFLNRETLNDITPEEALVHPIWMMGRRISIDSSTLMNKAFEIIEASHLFDIDIEKIDVVIHPESIVHSMVEFSDGSILAQMSVPDMSLPIAYSLTYPKRLKRMAPSLDLSKIGSLTFKKPDLKRFPSITYGYNARKIGGTMPAVLNAADEVCVSDFLEKKISFNEIFEGVKKAMSAHKPKRNPTIEEILEADAWARNYVKCLHQ